MFAADKGGAVTAERIAADLAVPVDDVLTLMFSTRLHLVQGRAKPKSIMRADARPCMWCDELRPETVKLFLLQHLRVVHWLSVWPLFSPGC